MRRIIATVLVALSAAIGMPGIAHAGGPTSVLITQPGQDAGALYYSDAAYDALLGLLPADETRGKPVPPASGGDDYNLTWMVHDVMPWRFDRVHVAGDGTAWVSTTFSDDRAGGWQQVRRGDDLVGLLASVLTDDAAPEVVTLAPEAAPATPGVSSEDEAGAWFSLTGWRWVVPGVLLGLLVGVVTAHRRVDQEPRQVLLTSDS